MRRKFRRTACYAFLLILIFYSSSSNAIPKENIDSIANSFLKHNGSSCIVLAISDQGLTKYYCYGTIDKNSNQPADSNTLFEIGSITKVFTATVAAMEVYEGKLKYTDSLSAILKLPRCPQYYGHEIKVIDLLHHSSALPAVPDNMFNAKNFSEYDPYANYNRSQLDSFLSHYQLIWMPGISYSYSNTGFGLMGEILSRLESKPYEEVIREKIWGPAGMAHTTITLTDNQKKNMASPYKANGAPDHVWNFDALAGAGAIRSDLKDMVKFLNISMNPHSLKNKEIEKAMRDCQTLTINADNGRQVGLGWHIDPLGRKRIIWHNGGTGGYRSYLGFIKGTQKGVVVLTNSATSTDNIGVGILEILDREK